MENYRAGGEAIGKYIKAHLPPPRDDGLEVGKCKARQSLLSTYRIQRMRKSTKMLLFVLTSRETPRKPCQLAFSVMEVASLMDLLIWKMACAD